MGCCSTKRVKGKNDEKKQIFKEQELEALEDSSKQFGVSVRFIMRSQSNTASSDENWTDVGGLKKYVDKYTQQITAALKPAPAYCYPIPKIIPTLCVRILQYVGLYAEGIFRRSMNATLLKELIAMIDRGRVAEIEVTDCHAYAVLLKTWLCKLSDPLISQSKYKVIMDFARDMEEEDAEAGTYKSFDTFNYYNNNDTAKVSDITTCIDTHLSPVNNLCLKYLVRFLRIFTIEPYVKTNLMSIHNIAVVMAPNLMRTEMLNHAEALAYVQLEIGFAEALIRRMCVTAAEEALFELLDTNIRTEMDVPEKASCSILRYYSREGKDEESIGAGASRKV